MASSQVPYCSQDSQQIADLIKGLSNGKTNTKKGFRARKTNFKVKGSPDGATVDSWRLNDWDYKKPDLPTYARGLFTTKNRRNEYEIAVRGYDKFFNIDEVSDTKWSNILKNTKGPYELTLKENGCIIFISGLEDGTLLVCSKHSTGDRSDVEISHAAAGEKWIDTQLANIGKTREDLARELRQRNVTAVAELCDDSFEEHILAYGPEKAGLYLHGVNLNLPEFMTYPSTEVQKFAEEWGFRKIGLQIFDDPNAVKTFLEGAAETGAHEGRDVEGFVIRCKMSPDPDRTPYVDWFFKYKFDEPYLMYRQWRECTKAVIAGNPPKYKKHKKITEEYLQYARKRLVEDPKLGKLYLQNHGIIALRDDFLAFKHMKGSEAANMENEAGEGDESFSRDLVLVPIATIGCGKTTVGVALTHLFGWSVVQNDNITGKQRPKQMVSQIFAKLMEHPVVISDRNNAERREREQIITDLKTSNERVRLVALNFAHGDMEEVRRVTRERVLKRGDNHQTIQAQSDQAKVLRIMEDFIYRFQPCDPERTPDDGFDLIIDLDPTQDSRHNLEIVVHELQKKYPALIPQIPTEEEMDRAIKAAIEDYNPDLRHTIPDRARKNNKQDRGGTGGVQSTPAAPKKKGLEYMSISIPAKDVTTALEAAFKGTDTQTQRFYRQLQGTRRVQNLFHVTLMHRATAKEHPDLWARYTALEAENASASSGDGKLDECDVQLERVVWDDRIMAIVVRILDDGDGNGGGRWTCVNRVPHVTIGTRDNAVKPRESNDLLARWLQVGSGAETGIGERPLDARPVVRGSVRAVLSR